ncbi:MAG: four helix bundle protein [Chthoniobacterales bacterium]|nr:four helix bundle protein [Chthoniobacterales bacterium]
MKKNYKDLLVWQKAIQLTPHVYSLVKKFPKEETFALGMQICRAVISVASNIAEGQARGHKKEFLQHLNIAKGSLAELHTQMIIAEKLSYLKHEEVRKVESDIDILWKVLHGLINSLHPV